MKFACVGAGFSGAVIANKLANAGYQVIVFESRNHVAGNCYCKIDKYTGILEHIYGPHIFHTNDEEVWSYINNWTEFKPYINRVKTTYNGKVYSLPINLHTINQYFNKSFSPKQAQEFIALQIDNNIKQPQTFEQQALKFIGKDLYQAFLKGYTEKQWGISPKKLPASILKRLPLRFNYDDNYFNHKYQGIPANGYTEIIEKMLSHKNITVKTNTQFNRNVVNNFDHVFYSGAIDTYFNYKFGLLDYRTLTFKREVHDGNYQGTAVMNYADKEIPYTRITEHKYFTPWKPVNKKTIIYKEYSRLANTNDIPYYPIRYANSSSMKTLKKYLNLAKMQQKITFIGRLGTYRYLDMDVTIKEALNIATKSLEFIHNKIKIPNFFNNPL